MGVAQHLKALLAMIGRAEDKVLGPKPDSTTTTEGAKGAPPPGMSQAEGLSAGFPSELISGHRPPRA